MIFGNAICLGCEADYGASQPELFGPLEHIFCALFFIVRVVGFTAITLLGLWPDTLAVLPTAAAAPARLPLKLFLCLGSAFNGLMLFWFADALCSALRPRLDWGGGREDRN